MNKRLITTLRKYFQNKPVTKAYVFGSEARGEANSKSDIDIFVELDHSQPIGLKYIKMQLELTSLLKRPVDMVSKPSKYIQPYIDKDKILIYEK